MTAEQWLGEAAAEGSVLHVRLVSTDSGVILMELESQSQAGVANFEDLTILLGSDLYSSAYHPFSCL